MTYYFFLFVVFRRDFLIFRQGYRSADEPCYCYDIITYGEMLKVTGLKTRTPKSN